MLFIFLAEEHTFFLIHLWARNFFFTTNVEGNDRERFQEEKIPRLGTFYISSMPFCEKRSARKPLIIFFQAILIISNQRLMRIFESERF